MQCLYAGEISSMEYTVTMSLLSCNETNISIDVACPAWVTSLSGDGIVWELYPFLPGRVNSCQIDFSAIQYSTV